MSRAERFDIVIVGGGLVGASLALMLAQPAYAHLKVALLDAREFPADTGDYQPAFDERSTALAWGSRLILEELGVWAALEEGVATIRHIHVSQQGHIATARFHADQSPWPAYGHVLPNVWAGRVLGAALHRQDRVTLHLGDPVNRIARRQGTWQIEREQGSPLEAHTLVLADGGRSRLSEQLGLNFSVKPYGQHAVVTNLAVSRPHGDWAWERFTPDGPLACLPLPDQQGQHRLALVWTVPERWAEGLKQTSEADFIRRLEARMGYRIGKIESVGERVTYPLSLTTCDTPVQEGLVVLGNAAHTLHPVAGQGFNLALRDARALARCWADVEAGETGQLDVLQRYLAGQRLDQQRTVMASDTLVRLFTGREWLAPARGLGLLGISVSRSLQIPFARLAMGLSGRLTDREPKA
ncbi:MAG: 2-octaprenyl-6-methoxyphenyl hydroxylase [Gammaproteobacteria bacterium]|nr:MAG: 2-octaprenyl-6-methoxyphenyl hydroxylase [Gammaproteobacteria bacterium]